LPTFESGAAVIGILGPFFKCPPAPFETAFMLHEQLVERGVRGSTSISIFSPLPSPIPISQESSREILAGRAERGIAFHPQSIVTRLEPDEHVAVVGDGRRVPYDLFLAIPVHKAPDVVVASGLTVDGWIPVDAATFATSYPDV